MSRSDQGTIFIDTLVAAAMVAVSLGAMYRVVSDSAGRHRMAGVRREAWMLAQSELATVGSAIPIQTGDTTGADGALEWRVRIDPYEEGLDSSQAGHLWKVTVTAGRQGETPIARLETLRLGPEPGP